MRVTRARQGPPAEADLVDKLLFSSEIREGGGFGFEGGDGFDEAGDREGIADAAGAADEAEYAAFASQPDGNAHEGGDAGAIDLGDAVEDHDDLARAGFDDGLECVVELIGRFTDGEAAVDFKHGHSARLADVDLHGHAVSHGFASIHFTCDGRFEPSHGIIRRRVGGRKETVPGGS